MLKVFLYFSLLLSFVNCTSGHCNRVGEATSEYALKEKKIYIYKYDGTKQCKEKKGISLNEMKQELDTIKVYSMLKKNDQLMRVQVCGALTGISNLFEIKVKDLPLAEALGFKKWDF